MAKDELYNFNESNIIIHVLVEIKIRLNTLFWRKDIWLNKFHFVRKRDQCFGDWASVSSKFNSAVRAMASLSGPGKPHIFQLLALSHLLTRSSITLFLRLSPSPVYGLLPSDTSSISDIFRTRKSTVRYPGCKYRPSL